MKTLYLSGAISGVSNHQSLFKAAQGYLEDFGYAVVNPCLIIPPSHCACNPDPDELTHTWKCNMRHDIIAMLEKCEGIAMMPNWYASRGANVELTLARGLGFEVGTVKQWVDWARDESNSY